MKEKEEINNLKIKEIKKEESSLYETIDITLRLIALGDSDEYKTNLINQYISPKNNDNSIKMESITLNSKIYQIEKKIVKLDIWNIPSQFNSDINQTNILNNINGAIIVCDINKTDYFEKIEEWKEMIKEKNEKKNLNFFLLVNKTDFKKKKIKYGGKALEGYYIEICSSNSTNIKKTFEIILKKTYIEYMKTKDLEKDKKRKMKGCGCF